MKKTLLLPLLLIATFSSHANIIHNDFSIVINGDASLGQGVHVHGGAYIGGNMNVDGWNSSFGSDIEAGKTSLYVVGDITGNRRLDLMNKNYYIGGDNKNNLQNSGSEVDSNTIDDDFFEFYKRQSVTMSNMEDSGVYIDSRDNNQIKINLFPGELNVINLNEENSGFLSKQNSNLLFNNFTNDTFVIVNYDLSSDLLFKSKNQNLQTNVFDNVIWNFYGGGELTMDQSVSTFKGSILAVDSLVDWKANDIDGQLVANELNWGNTSQSHLYSPWVNMDNFGLSELNVPLPDISNVTEPKAAVFLLVLLMLLINQMRNKGLTLRIR